MSVQDLQITAHHEGAVLMVRAQPGARKEGVLDVRNGSLRVAVNAAPEKGKANAAVAAVLADALGCAKSRITLLSGETFRDKRFLIAGWTAEQLRTQLAPLLPNDENMD